MNPAMQKIINALLAITGLGATAVAADAAGVDLGFLERWLTRRALRNVYSDASCSGDCRRLARVRDIFLTPELRPGS